MTSALHDWCYQSDRKKTLDFKANIRAFMKRFVIGSHVDNCVFMKNWVDEIWELRVQLQPRRERTRIFGTFAKDDCFIAVHQKLRSEFGGVDDPKWKKATDQAVDRWNTLFPDHHPIPAVPFSNSLLSRTQTKECCLEEHVHD